MQNPSRSKNESDSSSGPSSSYWTGNKSEISDLCPSPIKNSSYTEEKYSSHNSYYLTSNHNNANQIPGYFTPKRIPESVSACNSNARLIYGNNSPNSLPLTVKKSPVPFFKTFSSDTHQTSILSEFPYSESFLSPNRTSTSGSFKNYNSDWMPREGDSSFGNSKPCSVNESTSHKSVYKSPSSNFICSKCGLGFPCTLFLCKRAKTLDICKPAKPPESDAVKCESQSVDCISIRNNIDCTKNNESYSARFDNSSSVEDKSSDVTSINSSVSEHKKEFSSCSSDKGIENLISRLFPNQPKNKCLLSNTKKITKKTQKRHKNNCNQLKNASNVQFLKNTSIGHVTKNESKDNSLQTNSVKDDIDLFHLTSTGVTSVSSTLLDEDSNKIKSFEESISLSKETKNVLNKLVPCAESNDTIDKSGDIVTSVISVSLGDNGSKKIKSCEELISLPNETKSVLNKLIDCAVDINDNKSGDIVTAITSFSPDKSNKVKLSEESVSLSDETKNVLNELVPCAASNDIIDNKSGNVVISVTSFSLDGNESNKIKSSEESISLSAESRNVLNDLVSCATSNDIIDNKSGETVTCVTNFSLDENHSNEIKLFEETISLSEETNVLNEFAPCAASNDNKISGISNLDDLNLKKHIEQNTDKASVTNYPFSDSYITNEHQSSQESVPQPEEVRSILNVLTPSGAPNNLDDDISDDVLTGSNLHILGSKTHSDHNTDVTVAVTNFIDNNSNNKNQSSKESILPLEDSKNNLKIAQSTTNNTSDNNSNNILTISDLQKLNTDSSLLTAVVEESSDSKNMSVSNQGEKQCIDVTKDVTSALDLIEQSSLYDRNLSSAEICNSLNQIFDENNSIPVNEASTIENIQIEETPNLETNTVSLCVNDESEIVLQADSNADSETYINLSDLYLDGNSDNVQSILLIQDASGNVETLYLIQDSNGEGLVLADGTNIDALLASQGIADNTETIIVENSVDEVENSLLSQNADNAIGALTNEDFIDKDKSESDLGNSLVDSSTLINKSESECQDIIIYEDSSNAVKDVSETATDEVMYINPDKEGNANTKLSVALPHTLVENSSLINKSECQDIIIVEDLSDRVKDGMETITDEVMYINPDKEGNANTKVSVALPHTLDMRESLPSFHKLKECDDKVIEESSDEMKNSMETTAADGDGIICINQEKESNTSTKLYITPVSNLVSGANITEDSSDKVENILLTLSNNVQWPLGISNEKESVDTVNKEQFVDGVSVSNAGNSIICESLNLGYFQNSSKARKSISRTVSSVERTEENLSSIYSNYKNFKENFALSKESNKPNQVLQEGSFISSTSKSTPVNGAIFRSELSHAEANKVSFSNLNASKLDGFASIQMFRHKLSQKSKKTIISKSFKRSAKKSCIVSETNACNSDSTVSQVYRQNDSCSIHRINNENDVQLNMLLKRRNEQVEYESNKRTKNDIITVDLENESNNASGPKSRFVALKTFKKPFTSAKKSVLDSREARNTALKTCVPKTHQMKTASKPVARKQINKRVNETQSSDTRVFSKNITEENVFTAQSSSHSNHDLKIFQPEICEIRILPNDYLKRASLLLNPNHCEPVSPDDNVSDEEIKLSSGCTSPIEEILSFNTTCSCSAKEVPCLCSDSILQLTCEGEDSIDDTVVSCLNSVSQQYLLTPSSEIRHRAFCDTHLWRLRHHHCCPKCGIFCSQGAFLLCSSHQLENEENHLFHINCFLIPAPGLPPGCPHCCKFSNFNPIHLLYKSADSELQEVPSDSKNIAKYLDSCDIFMTVHKNSTPMTVSDSTSFIPEKIEIQQMITSLAKEKTLRLRPTGKCLYNPIKTGDVQKVMQMIGNGVNPNHKFRMHSNNAPLHVAAYYGWIGILHILLQAGALIDAVNDDLETPLIVAVERNHLPIVRYLVLAGAQIDVKDCNGMTSFHIASKSGFREIAEFLYNRGIIDINLQDDGGWTALVWASEHKHVDFVQWLLEMGTDPNVRDNEENTALHWAAYSGKSEIAKLLLDKGCTLSFVNKRGDSALHIAAREDNFECVKLFMTRGAVLDQKNKENKTPLMCCQDDSLTYNYLCQYISSGSLKLEKMQLEKHVVFRDISRGAEAYPIQAINEVDNEEFIMEFRYMIKNCHRSGVQIITTVNTLQFCYCKDNCLTRDCACFVNSKCWYDGHGCLTSEFESSGLPAIFECNKTCHCPKTCINRVVQQGLRCPLQLFRTRFRGWGVRTLQNLPKGAFVCEYVGELITGSEATQRDDDTYFFDLESKDSDYCLDGRYYGNVARFLNHSCEPNLMAVKVFVEHQDLNFPRIAFFTVRHIEAYEELCFDYGLDFWIVKSQTILCTCNAQSCKYSKDSIDDTLQKFFMDTKDESEVQSYCASPVS